MAVTKTYPIRKDLFKLDSWVLSHYDTPNSFSLFIAHYCEAYSLDAAFFIHVNQVCYLCKEHVPDEIQTLYILYKAGQ